MNNFSFAGHRTGRSLLMDDGTLTWLIANSNTASGSTRRHIELALCHLAQNGKLLTVLPHLEKIQRNKTAIFTSLAHR